MNTMMMNTDKQDSTLAPCCSAGIKAYQVEQPGLIKRIQTAWSATGDRLQAVVQRWITSETNKINEMIVIIAVPIIGIGGTCLLMYGLQHSPVLFICSTGVIVFLGSLVENPDSYKKKQQLKQWELTRQHLQGLQESNRDTD